MASELCLFGAFGGDQQEAVDRLVRERFDGTEEHNERVAAEGSIEATAGTVFDGV